MRVYVAGIGTCVPERIMTNRDYEKIVDTTDEWITTRTGIKERHHVDQGTATSDLALVAARRALDDARLEAKDLGAIIVATATPDMYFPSTACLLQHGLGANRVMCFDVAAGCTGFVYALGIGEAMVRTSADNVMVIGAECLTRITDWTDRASCILFGDGAGAVILRRTEDTDRGIVASYFRADGSFGDLLCMPAGGSRMPASHETVDRHLHTIKLRGNEVFKVAVRAMQQASIEVLKKAKMEPKEIDLFIAHQANLRIIDAAAKRLHLPASKVYNNIDRYGNTSTASIPLALREAIDRGLVKRGSNLLLVAFGAGFTWGSVIIKW